MVPRSLIAVLAVFCAASAYAQRTFEPAIPRGIESPQVAPAGELAPPAPAAAPAANSVPPRLVQNNRRSQGDADARHCLARSSNKDVHRCAQPYLSRSARSAVRKASAKRSTAAVARSEPARVVEPAKTGDTLKPAAPRASDSAKAADLVKPMDVTKPGGTPKAVESTAKAGESSKGAIPTADSAAKRLNLPRMGPGPDPTAAK